MCVCLRAHGHTGEPCTNGRADRDATYYMGVRIGATWRIRWNYPCAAAMRTRVTLL